MTDETKKQIEAAAEKHANDNDGAVDKIRGGKVFLESRFDAVTNSFTAGAEFGYSLGRGEVDKLKHEFKMLQSGVARLRAEKDAHVTALLKDLENVADTIDLSDWQNQHGSPAIGFYEASLLIKKALQSFKAKGAE